MEINLALLYLSDPLGFLCISLALDVLLGDPPYAWHPVRMLGRILALGERGLRAVSWDGRFGGFLLFLFLLVVAGGGSTVVYRLLQKLNLSSRLPIPWEFFWELYLAYSLLALGDLITHGRRIARATVNQDLPASRSATAMLVGRDTDTMDFSACNRAAVESLAESLVDGVISPLFWFALFGLPGLMVFKIASTMDSMVGYKNERYLHFGWFGARLDDVMNYIPARLTWLLMVFFSAFAPGYSARKAWQVGLKQHALLPGPNKGWSETAAAGALAIRLAGPIYKGGVQVNDLWIGWEQDREGGKPSDVSRMIILAYAVTLLFLGLTCLGYRLGWMHWRP